MTNQNGRFGIHGGQYIPETLMNAVIELEEAYNYYKNDPEFNRELTELLNEYAGRPSRLYFAQKMTKDLGGAKIYLKREDLNHTACKEDGKNTFDCRDRSRSAWSCHCYGSGAFRNGMCGVYGRRRHNPTGAQCVSDAASWSGSDTGQNRNCHFKRCGL